MNARFLMVQGTSSGAGKSRLVQALCRIFSDRGYRTAPFKAQNMALNSAVTADNLEIGRSTAEQAAAARCEAAVEMNPLLLKPSSDTRAQLIVMGKPYRNIRAADYFKADASFLAFKKRIIRRSLGSLGREYERIIMEGAGSPAEVNLRSFDIVNMFPAIQTNAPVLLVADIDRGGALASLVGTLELLTARERARIKGLVLNKFRGDRRLLSPALDWLERKTLKPVVGVLPYLRSLADMGEEDAVPGEYRGDAFADIDIAVIYHPHIANFTDLDALALEPRTCVRYVSNPARLGRPDAIIIPGTKNTSEDLIHMKRSGMARAIAGSVRRGTPAVGICGGYQMLGCSLRDDGRHESSNRRLTGLGLLKVETIFESRKTVKRVVLRPSGSGPLLEDTACRIYGYEVHHGRSQALGAVRPAFYVDGNPRRPEGAVSHNGRVFGTYAHDVFTQDSFRRQFVNALRRRKGLAPLRHPLVREKLEREKRLSEWVRIVRKNLNLKRIEELLR